MERYKRHYAMTEREVVAYLSGLQLSRLTKPGTFQVYSVPPDGSIKMHFHQYRAGTPVYADMTGTPVLIAKCGNPLGKGPKNPVAVNEDSPDIVHRQPTEKLTEGVPDVDLTTSEDLLTLAPTNPTPPVEEIVTIDQSPVTIIPVGVGFNPFGLGFLGFLFLDNDSDIQINPVPEPAGLAVLGLGVVGVLRLRNRARR